jgi:uridine phosphorylase
MRIPESELILNDDGSIYHLNIRPEHLAETVITVGDPDRVAAVSKYFDEVEFKTGKREFHTHTGRIGNKRLTVISTGIGTDNIDIVFNELDALVNIDLKTREVKAEHTTLDFIRIGTSGCLQADIPIDSFLVSSHGLGVDGLGLFYEQELEPESQKIFEHITSEFQFPLTPYFSVGSQALIDKVCPDFLQGITTTCTGFYGPQGRELRLKSKVAQLLPQLSSFRYVDIKITNFEMETAGIYLMANLLGHRSISCNAILANRITNEFSSTPKKTTERLIQTVLERWSNE